MASESYLRRNENRFSKTYQLLVVFSLIMFVASKADDDNNTKRGSYSTVYTLFNEKLGADRYNPEIRPVGYQSTITDISVNFQLDNIVSIDDVAQSMTVNGIFTFIWFDQMVAWDYKDYEYQMYLQPQPKQIWRPRMIVSNSLEERDPFQDKIGPVIAVYNGMISWRPGLQIPTSCKLKMDKYPFDVQLCRIEVCPMNHYSDSIRLINASSTVLLPYFEESQSWELLSSKIYVRDLEVSTNFYFSCFTIELQVKRRPMYYLINIVLPVIMMSFLNILVFVIPVDSGEKISYSITVLLALALFLSMISSMMPRASISVPAVSIYLFSLLVGSVLSVIMAIVVVALHNKDQKEEKHLGAQANFQHAVKSLSNFRHAIQSLKGQVTETDNDNTSESAPVKTEDSQTKRSKPHNRYRVISKYIDSVCFIVFSLLWLLATVWYFIYVTMEDE